MRWPSCAALVLVAGCGCEPTPHPDGGSTCDGGPCDTGGGSGGGATGGGDGGGGGGGGGFSTVGGEACDDAPSLFSPLSGDTTANLDDFRLAKDGGCEPTSAAPDMSLHFGVPGRSKLTFSVFSNGFDAVLNLVDEASCGSGGAVTSCVAAADRAGPSSTENLVWTNLGTDARSVVLLLDGYTATDFGPVGMFWYVSPLVDRDVCELGGAPITSTATLMNETLSGAEADYQWAGAPGCSTGATAGADRAYPVVVPAGQRLEVVLTPSNGWNAALEVVVDCNAVAQRCLASANATGANGVERTAWVNRSAADQTVMVVVDSASGPAPSTYRIDFTLGPPLAGDRCESAPALDGGLVFDTTLGAIDDYSASSQQSCAGASGPDRVYAVTVAAGQRLTATATAAVATDDPSLSLIAGPAAACDASPRVCLASADRAGDVESLSYFNASGVDQPLFLVVDTADPRSAGLAYQLEVTLDVPDAGSRCEQPFPLPLGVAVPGHTLGGVNDYSGAGSGCSARSGGEDVVYSVALQSGERLIATLTPAPGFEPSVALVSGLSACQARVCLASVDTFGLAQPVAATNRTASPTELLVLVDSASTAGPFSVQATATLAPAGEWCGNAEPFAGTPVDGGLVLQGQLLSPFIDDYRGGVHCAAAAMEGSDRAYAVDVPAGQRVTVAAKPQSALDVSLSLLDGAGACETAPRVCRASSAGMVAGGLESARASNFTTQPRQIMAVVDTTAGAPMATFDLTVTYDTPPPGEECLNAEVISAVGPTINQTTLGYANDYVSADAVGCVGSASLDRVYQLRVPAGQRLFASVASDGTWNPALNLVEGPAAKCSAATRFCSASADQPGQNDQLSWTNGAQADATVFLMVDSSSGAGPYSLQLALDAPPVGETCSNASATSAGTFGNQNLGGFARDLMLPLGESTCRAYFGPERVYAVTVGPGQQLAVGVLTQTGDAALNFFASPSACVSGEGASCLASSDLGGEGVAEATSWRNTGATPVVVLVAVGQYSVGSWLSYALTVELR